jgi:hypothetical protein
MNAEALLERFHGVQRSGTGWTAKCPAHEDRNPSLSISEGDGRILLHCHAGCTPEAVCDAAGVEMWELFADGGSMPRVVAEYTYQDECGKPLFQVVRYEPKGFRQRRPDGRGGWIWNLNGVRRVLYRLPEVLAASDVLIVEGERDVHTALNFRVSATCNPGGAGKWRSEYSEVLCGKRVTVIADADSPGRMHAQQVAASLHGKVECLKVVELSGAKDLSDWVAAGGTKDALLGWIDSHTEWKPAPVPDGAVLFRQIETFIRRFVFASRAQSRASALFIVHTHAFEASHATPYLAITSPEKQSGKTRLLEVLKLLVANPWYTGRVSAAVLIRKIDAERPTLLLDESDAAFGGEKEYAEALRGVLDTGHRRGGAASCCVGQGANISYRDFSTYCPKAIAGIGKLPDTVGDRAIPIRLKRSVRGEDKLERFRQRDAEAEAAPLRAQVEAWARAHLKALQDAHPSLPDELTDRQQDCAEPLLAIADAAGGEWPEEARKALVELCSQAQASDASHGVQLLTDIRQVFEDKDFDKLTSAELAEELAKIETSPWGEWNHGKPLTAARLAWLLRPFDIAPHNVRLREKVLKGYERKGFEDAWKRYLRLLDTPSGACPPSQTATPLQANTDAGSGDFSSRYKDEDVAVQKCEKPNKNAVCSGVAVSTPPTGAGEVEL